MGFVIPSPLLKDISKARCLPVIGAGFSMNGVRRDGGVMPDWKALAEAFAEEAHLDATLSPPDLAEQYEQKFGRVQLIEAIRSALRINEVDPGETHSAFVRLGFETIYTTNFDFLLEDAYTAARKPFRSLVGERQLPFHAGRDATNIVKMHGDLRHEEHIVITATDFTDFTKHYPVVATHLSAMLITKTPLFIGYSLADPDFRHLREVVRSRLGSYERMAYMIQFDWTEEQIQDALKDRVHVIALRTGPGQTRSGILTEFLYEVARLVDRDASVSLRTARPDLFEPLDPATLASATAATPMAAVVESASSLCFVSTPSVADDPHIYGEIIVPAVRSVGLAPMRADELPPSEGLIEHVRAAIQQSRVCVADVTGANPTVVYELELARTELRKPTLLIAREDARVPGHVEESDIIRYSPSDRQAARERLEVALREIMIQDKLPEAEALLKQKLDVAAVASASIVLEAKLRDLARQHDLEHGHGVGITRLTSLLAKHNVIPPEQRERFRALADIRNRAVHEGRVTSKEATEFVRSVRSFLASPLGGKRSRQQKRTTAPPDPLTK